MRVIKYVLIGLFSFIVLVFASGAYLIQKPDVLEFVLKKVLSKQKGVILKEFNIDHCVINLDSIYLSNMRMRVEFNDHDYDLTNVNLQIFIKDKNGRIDGALAIIDKYQFADFKGFFEIKDDVFYLKDIHSFFAKGLVKSQARYHLKNKTYFVNVVLKGIDISNSKEINDGIFGQINAVDGFLNLVGDKQSLKTVKGEFSTVQGGVLNRKILDYLTDNVTVLRGLFVQKEGVLFNNARLTISSLSLEQLRLNVKIKSLNINLNADIDINCEGGLESGLQTLQKALIGGIL